MKFSFRIDVFDHVRISIAKDRSSPPAGTWSSDPWISTEGGMTGSAFRPDQSGPFVLTQRYLPYNLYFFRCKPNLTSLQQVKYRKRQNAVNYRLDTVRKCSPDWFLTSTVQRHSKYSAIMYGLVFDSLIYRGNREAEQECGNGTFIPTPKEQDPGAK